MCMQNKQEGVVRDILTTLFVIRGNTSFRFLCEDFTWIFH